MPTIAHISDLHLQSGVPERQAQVEPILQKINAMKPDLVVISGDVTDDGWDSIEELKWAKAWLDQRIEGEWFAVPGNHDVGNFVSLPEGKITSERVQNWNQVFGFHIYHQIDMFPGLPVFGINSMLFGSGLKEEREQDKWIHNQLVSIDMFGIKTAVFMHSPLYVDTWKEEASKEVMYWLGPHEARMHMVHDIDMIDRPVIVGSGHVHQTKLNDSDYPKIAWAPPASGTWVHAPGLPNPPMPEKTGFFLHHLHDDGRVESELIKCAPMLKLYEHNPWP